MYNPIPCTQEQLIPTRWISNGYPSRQTVSNHLRQLRRTWGKATANECKSRMLWIGIFPVSLVRPSVDSKDCTDSADSPVDKDPLLVYLQLRGLVGGP